MELLFPSSVLQLGNKKENPYLWTHFCFQTVVWRTELKWFCFWSSLRPSYPYLFLSDQPIRCSPTVNEELDFCLAQFVTIFYPLSLFFVTTPFILLIHLSLIVYLNSYILYLYSTLAAPTLSHFLDLVIPLNWSFQIPIFFLLSTSILLKTLKFDSQTDSKISSYTFFFSSTLLTWLPCLPFSVKSICPLFTYALTCTWAKAPRCKFFKLLTVWEFLSSSILSSLSILMKVSLLPLRLKCSDSHLLCFL